MNKYSITVRGKVLQAINEYKMLEDTNEIVVGFSGGADSICLLHILDSIKNLFSVSVRAVHVNHGIRGDEADSDQEFTERFCNEHNIHIDTFRYNCIEEALKNKESIEECGRRLRYQAFDSVCGKKTKIATAHNANDNAETIIFNITRGSSVKGLCGIPFVRDNIIRPLLYCSRKEIEGYCEENYLTYVTDSTNADTDYTRNKIRHLILPVLEEINPSYLSSFNALTNNARDVTSFLANECRGLIDRAEIDEFRYDREELLKSDKALVTELLCTELARYCNLLLDNKKANALYHLLKNGGRLQISGDVFAEVKKNYFRFYRIDKSCFIEPTTIDSLPFEKNINEYCVSLEKLSDNSKIVNQFNVVDMVDCNTISGNLVLRTRMAGDSFTFPKRNVTKSLKKLFTEENLSIEIRNKIPVISDDKGVVWIYGFGVTKRCCANSYSDNIILVRGKNNDR